MRTCQEIKAEIEDRLGLFPHFFTPAEKSPQVLDNLWLQTKSAYDGSSLCPIFRERLSTLLSRFCIAPFTMIVHVGHFRPRDVTPKDILCNLDGPLRLSAGSSPILGSVDAEHIEAAAPRTGSPLENVLLFCATEVFLELPCATDCRSELYRLLGHNNYLELVSLLAYLKSAHLWIASNPTVYQNEDQDRVNTLKRGAAACPQSAEFYGLFRQCVAEIWEKRDTLDRAAEELKKSYAQNSEMLESISDAFYSLDNDFRFTYVNGRAEQNWKLQRQKLIGHRIQEVFPQLHESLSLANLELVMADRQARQYEILSPVLNRWVEISVYPKAEGLSVYYRDIHFRKTAEDAIHESNERFQQMADSVPNIVWTAQPDGKMDYFNKRWYDFTGLNFEQTKNSGWEQTIHPEDLVYLAAKYSEALANSIPFEHEYRIKRHDGRYRWHLGRALPISTRPDLVLSWVGTCTDITDHKDIELQQTMLLKREHAIAEQLQNALQRPLPETTEGFQVRKYYQAALSEEAGVGGDFYDVFPLHSGGTALVIGDVSGKGLAAAVQVAKVRNMLRAFLYSQSSISHAVTDLNTVLSENGLLTGFSTLFVSVYDAHARQLTYVNCGQEPALLRRFSTNMIECLLPTGPVLGCMEAQEFGEVSVCMEVGDALAIFTDGLTEVGPDRLNMLGVEGVSALLFQGPAQPEGKCAAEIAQLLIERLIAGADEIAKGGVMRDDVCLLVAVAE